MTLNCKPGDMAFIVGSDFEQDGLIVTCLRRLCPGDVVDGIRFWSPGTVWVIDRKIKYWSADIGEQEAHICPDENLRPIRPTDGQDETLQWAGLPQPIQQPVPA
jgi:hypothetical protein